VVTGLVGIRRFRIVARGRADHAGTTPMSMRKDAGMTLFRLATWIADKFARISGAETVWNIGHMALRPGAANVVPSEAEMILEYRNTDSAALDRLEAALLTRIGSAGYVPIGAEATARINPALMAQPLSDTLAAAARELGEQPMSLPRAPATTPWCWRASCPRPCCSCRASAAARMTLPRTHRKPILSSDARSLRGRWPRCGHSSHRGIEFA
jgi:acetylornithine deacetylase/succinyl-diaminopimelate desuccinylase-like protein